jgi:amino acid transporter
VSKKLSLLSLSLLIIGSVDSIRNLPAAALAGSQLLNYFSLALIFFLLPCAIVSSWFSTQSAQGVFGWVHIGLGRRPAFMAVWFQSIQNILIFPTLFSFIAGTILYTISPELVEYKRLVFIIIMALIWGLTWINSRGIQTSSTFNSFCSITGLLIPFILILVIGLYWWLTQINHQSTLVPTAESYSWTSLTAIMLSFCGIDLAAVHAADAKPGAYPKAVLISVFIIFLSMLFGSIVLAMIIPAKQLSFISSIPQLIQLFFSKIEYGHCAFIINGLIAIGCIGAANNWLLAPIKGLGFAADEGFLNKNYTKLNDKKVPIKLLLIQASCISIISALFLIIPSINASYWIMLNSATQIYLVMYVLLFLSAIKTSLNLRSKTKIIVLMSSAFGLIGISISLVVSFALPPNLKLGSQLVYSVVNGVFLLFVILIPILNLYSPARKTKLVLEASSS